MAQYTLTILNMVSVSQAVRSSTDYERWRNEVVVLEQRAQYLR